MNTYWISFSSHSTNLGCCIIDAASPEAAIAKTNELGINPGGEAALFPIDDDAPDIVFWGKNKLISRNELLGFGYERIEDNKERLRKYNPIIICEDCNQ